MTTFRRFNFLPTELFKAMPMPQGWRGRLTSHENHSPRKRGVSSERRKQQWSDRHFFADNWNCLGKFHERPNDGIQHPDDRTVLPVCVFGNLQFRRSCLGNFEHHDRLHHRKRKFPVDSQSWVDRKRTSQRSFRGRRCGWLKCDGLLRRYCICRDFLRLRHQIRSGSPSLRP